MIIKPDNMYNRPKTASEQIKPYEINKMKLNQKPEPPKEDIGSTFKKPNTGQFKRKID